MHFTASAALLTALLVSSQALAQNFCPIVTRTELAGSCSKRCGNADCLFVTTVQNPCGCPASVPTATLIAPCQAECPYNGCGVEVRTLNQPCGPTTTNLLPTTRRTSTSTSTSTSRRFTRRPTTTRRTTTTTSSSTSTSTSTSKAVSTGIITLPPRPTTPTSTPCPTVTRTTLPADCPAIRCPVPNCVFQEQVVLPCGCAAPRTLLYVQGCPTACPEGCMTRTQTVSQACATG